ncbi:M4 family metallopeptidase [Nostoc sp. CHAB 5836]|uniref:M4 family metallopeptidase n=1 Tax=Nostoc sp. CHAB 5836 TaxID=2780404 RepID=UPI001E42D68C|nr:M4 family metallopeptidase [Nostoc sp. CHAB 5836]MCC5616508.1 M4 family metallopeptidase [Nostoc sp. CHAB 5836]
MQVTIRDYFDQERTLCYEEVTNSEPTSYFEDTDLKVCTYYINDYGTEALPGRNIVNPPPWQPQSISAYANACDVAVFFREVLEYIPSHETTAHYISSIQCIEDQSNQNQNMDAWWSSDYQQAFFGQCQVNNQFLCFAVSQDIVAHEFTHALTSWTTKLDYMGESGALDESYADIFGILIANFRNHEIGTWKWEIGNGFSNQGYAFRNLQQPDKCNSKFIINGQPQQINHPAHMDNFLHLSYDKDHGGVHHNCSIHNHAAYKLLISQNNETNEYLFDASTVAVLFYQALKKLGPKSGFTDSRLAIENIAKTLFRGNPPNEKQKKLGAIATAFDSVGIVI